MADLHPLAGTGRPCVDDYADPPDAMREARACHARRSVMISPGEMKRMVDEAADALCAAGCEIYQRGGQLVRPVRLACPDESDGVRRPAGALTLAPVDATWVRLQLATHMDWARVDERQRLAQKDPPAVVAKTLAEVPDCYDWPAISAVVRHPVLWPDGTWTGERGLHRGILVDIDGAWHAPGTTRAEAEDALRYLRAHYRHYRWSSPTDEAVALALVLTAPIRCTLRSAPLHVLDAPEAGSGTSLFVDSVHPLRWSTMDTMRRSSRSVWMACCWPATRWSASTTWTARSRAPSCAPH